MIRVTLIGYYGHHNLGDDLMLRNLAKMLAEHQQDIELTVCAAGPLSVSLPPSTRTIITPSLRGRVAKAIALARSDVVIWGGGTCLYENGPGGTAGMAGIRRVLTLCRASGTRFVLLAIGVGQLYSARGEALVREIAAHSDATYCRDETSRILIEQLVGHPCAKMAGDLFFLDPPKPLVKKPAMPPRVVAFCGAGYYADCPDVIRVYRTMIRDWLASGTNQVVFVPMHRGRQSDHEFHRKLAAGLPTERYTLADYASPDEAVALLANADVAVAFRLHGLVIADAIGLPCLGVAYSPKITAYAAKMGPTGVQRIRQLGESIASRELATLCQRYPSIRPCISDFIVQETQMAKAALADVLRCFCFR